MNQPSAASPATANEAQSFSAQDSISSEQASSSQPARSFDNFARLEEALQRTILSFVADAPFESLPENYPHSSLTHEIPQVSKQFQEYALHDSLWKPAILRQARRESFLWRGALFRIAGLEPPADIDQDLDAEQVSSLVDNALAVKNNNDDDNAPYFSYKDLFREVVTHHLRFCGPVFYMTGSLQLGEPYALHFFEPRYRLLIQEVMREQPENARNGGVVDGEALFIHANRAPLAPTTPATIVKVVRCQMYNDGRSDVVLLPTAYVWLERTWVRPNSGHLYYAQCLRMGKRTTNEMNYLARQEALASVMDLLAGQFAANGEETETGDEAQGVERNAVDDEEVLDEEE